MIRAAIVIALSASLLAGCARQHVPAPSPARYAAEPTLAVAQLLAAAETVALQRADDAAALAPILAALDGFGAHPVVGTVDPASGWRALSGVASRPMRGRMLGPAYRRGMLDAGASVTLDQLFDGGRQARVAVAAPDAAPVAVAVRDGAGKAVCAPNHASDGQCNWVPPYSARHQIVISNPGPSRAAYYLVID